MQERHITKRRPRMPKNEFLKSHDMLCAMSRTWFSTSKTRTTRRGWKSSAHPSRPASWRPQPPRACTQQQLQQQRRSQALKPKRGPFCSVAPPGAHKLPPLRRNGAFPYPRATEADGSNGRSVRHRTYMATLQTDLCMHGHRQTRTREGSHTTTGSRTLGQARRATCRR
jgi:hypothetical protein